MGRSVQLPKFTDLGTLPATHRGVRAFGRIRMRKTILNRPAADLGAIELEGVQSQCFRGNEAVRARRRASQTFFEEAGDGLGPSGGVVATRGSGDPQTIFFSRTGAEVRGGECIKAAAG